MTHNSEQFNVCRKVWPQTFTPRFTSSADYMCIQQTCLQVAYSRVKSESESRGYPESESGRKSFKSATRVGLSRCDSNHRVRTGVASRCGRQWFLYLQYGGAGVQELEASVGRVDAAGRQDRESGQRARDGGDGAQGDGADGVARHAPEGGASLGAHPWPGGRVRAQPHQARHRVGGRHAVSATWWGRRQPHTHTRHGMALHIIAAKYLAAGYSRGPSGFNNRFMDGWRLINA